jgi:hypothetical protein
MIYMIVGAKKVGEMFLVEEKESHQIAQNGVLPSAAL